MADPTFDGFTPCQSQAIDGFFFDFLGTRTRVSYLPENCQWLSGKVFGLPVPGNLILYEYGEWIGVMAAVKEAKGFFVCVELGAGWAPWLVSTVYAVRQRSISDLTLVAVEAEEQNIAKIHTHFTDSGLSTRPIIHHAAIGERDARPSPAHPGGAALISIKTVLKNLPIVDLIHCDIQYAEAGAFAASMPEVTQRVRRVVVGTHSRTIEDQLIDTFRRFTWRLEHEAPCKYAIESGAPCLLADGVQVWSNPARLC
jgi:hypothetical protein